MAVLTETLAQNKEEAAQEIEAMKIEYNYDQLPAGDPRREAMRDLEEAAKQKNKNLIEIAASYAGRSLKS